MESFEESNPHWKLRLFGVSSFSLSHPDISIAYEDDANIFGILLDGTPVTYHDADSHALPEGSVVFIDALKLKSGAYAKHSCNVRLCDENHGFDLRFASLPDANGFIEFLNNTARVSETFELTEMTM